MRTSLTIALILSGCTEAGVVTHDDPEHTDTTADTDVVETTDTDLPGSDGLDLTPFADAGSASSMLIGTWRDLDHWDFWTSLTSFDTPYEAMNARWGFDTRQRFRVMVTDGAGPVQDAQVELYRAESSVFTARTDDQGQTNLFGGLLDGRGGPWNLTTIAFQYVAQEFAVVPTVAVPHIVDLTQSEVPDPKGVDLLIAIDRRAKMADALELVQAQLQTWLEDARDDAEESVQISIVLFDHEGIVTAPWSDLTAGLQALADAEAQGSGAAQLDDLFEHAADQPWREHAKARTMLLITASSDLGSADLKRLQDAVPPIAALGVRVQVVQTDPTTDGTFLLRNLAIATDGAWHFALKPGRNAQTDVVGDFTVQELSTLVRSLVVVP